MSELEKQIMLLQDSIEMFQIEKVKNLQLMDELRLALQASTREKKALEERVQHIADGSHVIINGKIEELREALQVIVDKTSFHSLKPLKQINEVNEVANKALWRCRP